MRHEDKLNWMRKWASDNQVALDLKGEVGFGRECVGITTNGCFPDYDYGVWTPKDAYHKHDCVAVLGHGEDAQAQLYDWLKWFDENGYKVKTAPNQNMKDLHPIELLLGRATTVRMVKP